ncbi:uncharacterized protein AB675_10850 [Cyphellophora attinorum]|uniref:Uncharacterized protein n=1 Tax=Cyphellophora attinorum TaxID=1664694 RepID=A0A0N0NMR7_9EURO|nr:uncharacterized protein AB675_10850 [Phialophora attinorum]KPI40771.1 hypothetical protein AB675_10850 [Phialophora attinorum]
MAACLLLSDITTATSNVVRMLGVDGGLIGLQRDLEHQVRHLEDHMERRQSNTATVQSTTISMAEMNSTIARACLDVLDDITVITNDAGLSACYNIMSMDRSSKTFVADLRLYIAASPKGAFTQVQPNNLMIGVTYPPSTKFTTLNTTAPAKTKRQAVQANNMTEIQQYTFMGEIDTNIDLEKLTEAQIMSLMVPAITINAVSQDGRTPLSTPLAITDTAFFVVGDFLGGFTADTASPQFQKAAIEQSSVFVLPGTTFGIFPVGLIVTGSWLAIFVAAYGFGTWKRYQHREFYRKRMHVTSGGALKGYDSGRTGRKI